jgi:hypothetical protein
MKNRGIGFGNVIFLGVIISLFAGCNPGLDQDGPLVDENGNYIITINTTSVADRSIAGAEASLYTKEYEIVCYDGTNFYSGYAEADKPLTVSLPEGTYDMLLLAGNGNRVLLGTGLLKDKDIGPSTADFVTIIVDPLTILDTEMLFDDNDPGTSTDLIDTTTTPPILTVGTASTKLTTKFKLHNMQHLVDANEELAAPLADIYITPNGFRQIRVALEYVRSDTNTPIPIVLAALSATPSLPTDPELVFDDLNYPASIGVGTNWSALVYLDVRYIPFGQPISPTPVGHEWSILNGLSRTASNGAILIKSGNGGNYDITVSH